MVSTELNKKPRIQKYYYKNLKTSYATIYISSLPVNMYVELCAVIVNWLNQLFFARSDRSTIERRTSCLESEKLSRIEFSFFLLALVFYSHSQLFLIIVSSAVSRHNTAQPAPVPLLRSLVGILIFWDSGMDPPAEWPTWASKLKLAIMAKDSINVDSLLRQKPEAKDVFYPADPTYEPATQNKTQAQHCERDLRNNKRISDWEKVCKGIEFKFPTVK